MNMQVPFFDYPRLYKDDKELIVEIIDEVASRGAFILQKDLDEFEKNLAKFTGSEFAVGVGNATDGLELAWMSAGLKEGDEVICSSHTMLATASSIVVAGGTPVPVDIGDDNLICPEAVENAINDRTVGIMPTHVNGRVCDMGRISDIAARYRLTIVEDAAQALGARWGGRHAGTFGFAGAISFYPAKVLGCLGDGGGVLIQDEETFGDVYALHDHGRDRLGDVKRWGRNSRLDNIQAALLNKKLSSYNDVIIRRRKVASMYQKGLEGIRELVLPPAPVEGGVNFDIYQNYEMRASGRNELKDYLKDRGIGTLIQWGGVGIHQFRQLGFEQELPNVDRFFNECIMLPMNIFLSDEQVEYVVSSVKEFYQ